MSEVRIRPILADDAVEYNAYRRRIADEADNMVTLSAGEYTRTVDEEHERILSAINSPDQHILVAETQGKIVGSCTCRGINRAAFRHAVSLGVDIAPEYRGRGLGNSLLHEMIEWARAHPVIRRVELHVFSHNRTAINLYLKHGFAFEGLKKQAYYKYGRYVDAYIMAIIFE